MPIRLLPAEIASQIAAGEVVERPASVVKELLENALDAGASRVQIRVEQAGHGLIEVSDDGSGIPAGEMLLAVQRHATSKLRTALDLFHITTLGFRGEALASIGSVARLTVISRPADQPVGAALRIEGGLAQAHDGQPEAVGAPAGTLVRVEDLFYNVPARRKFLKNDLTERRQIDVLVTRYALAYPQVRFTLIQEGRPALQTSGNGIQREVLSVLYGVETARQMLEVNTVEEGLNVTGFISPPGLTRSNRKEITFFVNGRPVQDAALSSALLQGYQTMLMVGRYPLAILFLQLPPESVDVNVHPTKAEVRFQNNDRIFSGVQRAVRRALLASAPAPLTSLGVQPQAFWPPPARRDGPAWGGGLEQEVSPSFAPNPPSGEAFDASTEPGSEPGTPPASGDLLPRPLLRLVGQVASAYLAAEGPDGLYLIDQHAAHERVLFERFQEQRRSLGSSLPSQALLQPAAVTLPPAAARLLEAQLDLLEALGFGVEAFGPETFLVRRVPALLAGVEPGAALRVLVEDFEEDETPLQAESEARLIARVCKRAAVKAGQPLSAAEQNQLVADLLACRSPRTCPHGRPTMIHLSVDVLERQFGRRGAR